ncbi:MAG: O-methyltransferase [Gaiellaceae bacterium]
MASKTLPITDELHEYLMRETVDEPEVLRRLREETATLPNSEMQLLPEQGQLLRWLVELIGARRTLEVGTFTGYSAACVALAMGEEGRVVACDISEEWTQIARRYWQEAGVTSRIDLRLGPAVDTLESLLAEGSAGSMDFAFIDADKNSYPRYYELCLELVREGGVVAIDNALWRGRVADAEHTDGETEAVRAVTRRVFSDTRVSATLMPIGDGLILARKR